MLDGILDECFSVLRENATVVRLLILFAVGPILIILLSEFFKDGLNIIGKSPWFSSNCEISDSDDDADECADDGDDELWNPFDDDDYDDDYDSD